ncbi:MAG: tetratricopeptide repeat protein [Candidatus Omnitrophica bacterium]|nr:tetratricopeptide repeat protein [Candidatus Omnitrophota bacterium]
MKNVFVIFLIVLAFVFLYLGQEQTTADYNKLKRDYNLLLKDKNNLQKQIEILLPYKNEIAATRQQMSLVEKERRQKGLEKQSLNGQIKKLLNENSLLMDRISLLESEQAQLQQERNETRKSLAKEKAENIIGDDLKKKVKRLEKEIALREKNAKKKQAAIGKAENKAACAEEKAYILRKQLEEVKNKYDRALAQNKVLENKLERQPREYAEVARENKMLIKRTALMQYNLGVFYTKNKDYPRAIAEFEKAIELNPENAQAYFNLGYIYAEYFEDRAKAIKNFQKYLQLVKKDDKDIDWVKKYILTWQTWEGKSIGK